MRKNKGRLAIFVGLLLLLLLFSTGDSGFYVQAKLLRRQHRLESKINQALMKQAQLRQQIDSLKNDPKALEEYARKELGVGEPDEVIIKFNN